MPTSTTTVTRISVLDIMFGGAEHEKTDPMTPVTIDPDQRDALRHLLHTMRKYEDALIATGLTPKQFNLLVRLRTERWKLWEAIPGILSDPEA
jgi:hypothetical protein